MRRQLIIVIFSLFTFEVLAKDIGEIFKDKTSIENPFGLRDPFRPPVAKGIRTEGREEKQLKRDGIYTNLPEIGLIDIAQMQVVGVMIGTERRAMVKTASGSGVLVLKEGMKLGRDGAELKAIHPGGIILVEKLVNVYGEEEYLETVIPISQ